MTNAMLSKHLFVILLYICILSLICKTAHGGCFGDCECEQSSDCGENAECIEDNICVCEPGFYDFPPMTKAVSDGCLGECDQLGVTSQCEGITECTLSPQGFGVCTCPADTFGPPQCLGECDQLGVTNQCEGITECTLSPQGFGVCTCPADTFGPPQCLDDCESNVQCNLRGNCEKGKCVCFSGFQGKNCEESLTTPESVTKKRLKKLPLLIGALTFPLLLLVPAGLVSAINLG